MEFRTCSKCGLEKPIDQFQKDKSKKSGYKSQCKQCIRDNPGRVEYLKNYRVDHRDYYREKHSEYRARNREKLRDDSRKRYRENPEKARIYYAKNKDRLFDYYRRYRKTEHGKAIKIVERVRRRSVVCIGDNDITIEALYNRSTGICALCGGYCDFNDYVYRGTTFIAGNHYPSIDHIVPISKGGSHTWDNVQLAHKQCNSIKSDKTL